MKFTYAPFAGSIPIHQVADRRHLRIEELFWRLWSGDNETLPSIDVREISTAPRLQLPQRVLKISAMWLGTSIQDHEERESVGTDGFRHRHRMAGVSTSPRVREFHTLTRRFRLS